MRDGLFSVKDKLKAQDLNPLVHEGQKMILSVTRVFHRSKEMHVYLQTYQQEIEIVRPTVGFVSFYQGAAKVLESPPIVVSQSTGTLVKALAIQLRDPLDGLAPGEYNCQITVLNPEAKKPSFWQAPIMGMP